MSFVEWKRLTAAQKIEATQLRPRWHLTDFKDFAFWVKADGHLSRRGGHHEMTEGAYKRIVGRFSAPPRTKGDLAEWTGSPTFHLNRE